MDKIDFVITWVDNNDIEWQKSKLNAMSNKCGDLRLSRYRDWETLKYWFRSIEKFAPWVNKIYFVTCGHYPKWLNIVNPKLVLMPHKDFIPSNYLPTFSSRCIDFNFHRIPGLSEHFVYFNDDMFLTDYVSPNDFFKNGLPCYTASLDADCASAKGHSGESFKLDEIYSSPFYITAIINKHFNKTESIKNNIFKWFNIKYGLIQLRTALLLPWKIFTGIRCGHTAYSFCKSAFEEVWNAEHDVLDLACSHKFRTPTDVSSQLISCWLIAKGQFYPRSPKRYLNTWLSCDDLHNQKVFDYINSHLYKMICINDEYVGDNFEIVKSRLNNAFNCLLPEKSSFEL